MIAPLSICAAAFWLQHFPISTYKSLISARHEPHAARENSPTVRRLTRWTPSADPNTDLLEVGGADYWVENTARPWSLTSPAANALRFEVRAGDVWTSPSFSDPSTKERSEIAGSTTYAQGTPISVSYDFEVEPGAANHAPWLVAGQFHQSNVTTFSPPFEIDFDGGDRMSISINQAGDNANSWSAYKRLWTDSRDIVRGQVYSMQISADFDPVNGYLLVIRNGVTLVDYHGPLGYSTMGDVYWKEGVYRAASDTAIAIDYRNLSITSRRAPKHADAAHRPERSVAATQTPRTA